MFNLRHKRDRFLLVDRAGTLQFKTQSQALRYLNQHGYMGQYDVVPALKLGSLSAFI